MTFRKGAEGKPCTSWATGTARTTGSTWRPAGGVRPEWYAIGDQEELGYAALSCSTRVISGEVGLRKPEEEIFLLAAAQLGLAPQQCVFIDDIQANVDAATALGMAGVRHRDPLATTARLAGLLNLPLG